MAKHSQKVAIFFGKGAMKKKTRLMGVCGRIDPFQVVLEDVPICIILADTVAPG